MQVAALENLITGPSRRALFDIFNRTETTNLRKNVKTEKTQWAELTRAHAFDQPPTPQPCPSGAVKGLQTEMFWSACWLVEEDCADVLFSGLIAVISNQQQHTANKPAEGASLFYFFLFFSWPAMRYANTNQPLCSSGKRDSYWKRFIFEGCSGLPVAQTFSLWRMYAAEITKPYKCVWDKHRALPYLDSWGQAMQYGVAPMLNS